MAAFETPWLVSMSPPSTYTSNDGSPAPSHNPNSPTIAAFSPQNISGTSTATRQRSTIIVHKKSPLLVATPPQVTRALAYSHPFILPLNKLAGLLSWSTDDPWESFLTVAGFWAVALYGSELLLWAGPILVVIGVMLGMYSRRYSPLSSTAQTGEKHGQKKDRTDDAVAHHKSLDEIVEALRIFTFRCNLLLEPFLSMTDFLSTQRTPTSATTRPALTTLFIRILLMTPIWVSLTLPPFYILTCRRAILTFGTLALTWHSRPARVSRHILWRSLLVRRTCSFITGLQFSVDRTASDSSTGGEPAVPPLPPRQKDKSQGLDASSLGMKHRPTPPGVRFTFILYENQRRWLGLGWTSAMLAYERASWTDEHLNPAPNKDRFELPEVESETARWRWVQGSHWKIEGETMSSSNPTPKQSTPSKPSNNGRGGSSTDGGGWIYYDNKWNEGKRGVDSWGKYTRRRKWYRDAELVEITPSTEVTPNATPNEAAALSDAEIDPKAKTSTDPAKKKGGKFPAQHILTPPSGSTASFAGSNAGNNKDEDGNLSDSIASSIDHPPNSDLVSNHMNTKTPPKRKSWFGNNNSSTTTTPSKTTTNSGGVSSSSSAQKSTSHKRHSSKSGYSSSSTSGTATTATADDHLDRWKGPGGDEDGANGVRGFGLGEDVVMGLS